MIAIYAYVTYRKSLFESWLRGGAVVAELQLPVEVRRPVPDNTDKQGVTGTDTGSLPV